MIDIIPGIPDLLAGGLVGLGFYIRHVLFGSKREGGKKKSEKPDFSGLVFGMAVLQNGGRSPFEHALITSFLESGAMCVLAGRNAVRGAVLDKDVIDTMLISNPQFVVVGRVEEEEIFIDDEYRRPERSKRFYAWWKDKYPLAFKDNFQRNLLKYYQLRHEEVYRLYMQETGESPYEDDSGRKYRIRVSLDCHSASGVVVGSYPYEREFYHRDRDFVYCSIANTFVARVRIPRGEDVENGGVQYPHFAQGQVDSVLSQHGYYSPGPDVVRPTRQLSEEELPRLLELQDVDALIGADQPGKTTVLQD